MNKTLFWLQGGGCGGDSMALIGLDGPDLFAQLKLIGIDLLWHPSLSNSSPKDYMQLIEDLLSGKQPLDILCVEGAVIRGPSGTGIYDTYQGRPKKDLIAGLAGQAKFVTAVGTCASYGGIGTDGDIEACGLQFQKKVRGGFLGADFVSGAGLPVVNLPGCPCHPEIVVRTLASLDGQWPLALNEFQAPLQWFGMLVHQGCIRNEYHEYRVEETRFGSRGCLFFHLGCQGPLTHGPCNKLRWNNRNSKTSAGVPCVGCTDPEFPKPHPFFKTRNIAGIPYDLPDGVDRAHYLAYKGMAAAAAPERLRSRKTRV